MTVFASTFGGQASVLFCFQGSSRILCTYAERPSYRGLCRSRLRAITRISPPGASRTDTWGAGAVRDAIPGRLRANAVSG